MTLKFKLGADPEFFLMRGDSFVAGFESGVWGDKYTPQKLDKGDVQVDGTALEIGIDPASSAQEFSDNCEHVMAQVRDLIGPEFSIAPSSEAIFPEEYFNTIPDHFKMMGCQPDFNGFELKMNKAMTNGKAMKDPRRFAGGHLHISIEGKTTEELVEFLLPVLDKNVGLYCLSLDPNSQRLSTYGAPSNFRPKDYGIEYRTPSAMWLLSGPEVQKKIYELVAQSIQEAFEDAPMSRDDWQEVRESFFKKAA